MIFIDRHIVFSRIAAEGRWLVHADTQRWWARHAIAGFTPHSPWEETDPDEIAKRLDAYQNAPRWVNETLWTALYHPQVIASINAAEMALRRELPVHTACWDANMYIQDRVIDWLHMLAATDHRLLSKLHKITWPQAVLHARNWQDAKERQTSDRAGTEGTTEILVVGKHKWFRLDTIEAIRREGEVMRNCLGNGDYDHVPNYKGRREYDGLYSLRDATGHSLVTALLWRGKITQAHERANRPIRPEYTAFLQALTTYVREKQKGKTTQHKGAEVE